jgi:hypothetical protein
MSMPVGRDELNSLEGVGYGHVSKVRNFIFGCAYDAGRPGLHHSAGMRTHSRAGGLDINVTIIMNDSWSHIGSDAVHSGVA